MKIGFIGLGKMGGNMTKRLIAAGHQVVALDPNEVAQTDAKNAGATVVADRQELISNLEKQIIWLMIPSQLVDAEIEALLALVQPGAIIIDGGNSDFRLSQKRAETCKAKDVVFLDVGTSGGILGLENGYAIMVGGDEAAVAELSPIFDALAPVNGWSAFGESGSGHYVKMVHNAIEYGLMESYAEGYRMLKDGPIKNIDLAKAGGVWQHGSIIESKLNELTTEALIENPDLEGIDGFVKESGEARWALEMAKDNGLDAPAISASFDVRLQSQQGQVNFATKLLAAMRNKFGGHAINKEQS
jgi:6-phosphogluconate dehydrogenase